MYSADLLQRSETKPLEHRSALTPITVKQLLAKGFHVNVERSPIRIFDDKDFSDVGANLVAEGSWPDAPTEHIIIGLKELPEESCKHFLYLCIRDKKADYNACLPVPLKHTQYVNWIFDYPKSNF